MSKKRKIIITVSLTLFILITILVTTNIIKPFDDFIYNSLISFRSNTFDTIFKTITKFANTISIIIVVIVLLLILKKDDGILLGISTLSSVLVNTIIKYIIRRDRPAHLRLIKQGGYSFPSGHAMISVAVYGILIYIINKNIKNKKLKVTLTTFLLFLIIGIGLSRIYVGVHFQSDVIAGFSLATVLLVLIINYLKFEN